MNAISLWQPWASLVAAGIKRIETRSWGTNFRGPIAIHAAKYRLKKREREAMLVDLQAMTDLYFAKMGNASGLVFCPDDLLKAVPYGAVVAVVHLADCVSVESVRAGLSARERLCGDYRDGRVAWLLDKIQPLASPVQCRGGQGRFNLPLSVTDEVNCQRFQLAQV